MDVTPRLHALPQSPRFDRRRKRGAPVGTLVDDEDKWLIETYAWHLDRGYVTTNYRGRKYYLHRVVLGESATGKFVDHRNHLPLDNRKQNLRVGSRAYNNQNRKKYGGTSLYRGVSWYARGKSWQVHVAIAGVNYYLGRYADETEAGRVARDFRLANMPGALS